MPAEDSPEAERPQGRAWQRALTVALVVATVASVLGGVVRLPYYGQAPGEVVAIPNLVKVVDGPTFTPEGSVNLVTVYQSQLTPLEAVRGWLDPDVDVLPARLVIPPHVTRTEVRKQNLAAMASSKETALGVAFEHLGVDAIRGDGAEISQLSAGSAAALAGLREGDVITHVDGAVVGVDRDAIKAVGVHRPGDRIEVRVVGKDGKARTVTATLGARPEDAARPLLGVGLVTKNLHFAFPYEVELASDQIGGPSAGLGYTLEVLDVLTPGELTGGLRVAATGTIELDGSVGEIGGIRQKTAAVRRAGMDLFLVPRGELEAARRRAGAGLRVEPVDDLDDALRVLATVGGNGLALGRLPEPGKA